MRLKSLFGWIVLISTIARLSAPAAADDFYAGKRLTIIVGLEAGGTVDTLARAFSGYLRKHIPGNPAVVIQNMPGAGGWTATNFYRSAPLPTGQPFCTDHGIRSGRRWAIKVFARATKISSISAAPATSASITPKPTSSLVA